MKISKEGILSAFVILQLLVVATKCCPTDSPIFFNIQPCTDMSENDTMTMQDPNIVVPAILNCAIQVLDDLPQSETNELLVFAENVSDPEAAMIGLAVEMLENELETALTNVCPGVKWSCTLVAIRIDLRMPFGIQITVFHLECKIHIRPGSGGSTDCPRRFRSRDPLPLPWLPTPPIHPPHSTYPPPDPPSVPTYRRGSHGRRGGAQRRQE